MHSRSAYLWLAALLLSAATIATIAEPQASGSRLGKKTGFVVSALPNQKRSRTSKFVAKHLSFLQQSPGDKLGQLSATAKLISEVVDYLNTHPHMMKTPPLEGEVSSLMSDTEIAEELEKISPAFALANRTVLLAKGLVSDLNQENVLAAPDAATELAREIKLLSTKLDFRLKSKVDVNAGPKFQVDTLLQYPASVETIKHYASVTE